MKCFFTLFIIFLLSISSAFSQTFRFTAIPDENTGRLQKRFNKVAKYLSEQLNVNVKYVPVKSYSASVAAFKNDQVQLAWFGGLSGVKARRSVPGSVAIAQGEEDLQFVTYFIAHASTGVKLSKEFPAEIKGHTFTFGSKGSTSGRLMPEFFIRQHFKKEPNKIFKRVGFSGDHSKTIALVQSGSYEIGALNFNVWKNELKAGNIDTNKVRVIWKTPTYPEYNVTIRGDVAKKFGEDFIQKVKDALINLSDREVMDSFPRKRFIEADNSTYRAILETAIIIGLIHS